jgi:hypothetical protein
MLSFERGVDSPRGSIKSSVRLPKAVRFIEKVSRPFVDLKMIQVCERSFFCHIMPLTKILILGCLFFVLSICLSAQTTYETDFQLWNDTQFIVPLNKKKDLNAVVWVFGRFGNNVKTTTDARIGGLVTKKFNKYVTVGGGYLYRYSNPTFTRKRYESRYLGIATFTVPLSKDKKWNLVNRNIYQYENRYSRLNATVVRNRVWVKCEVTIAKKKIEPFVSFESFYDFRLGAFARYRTQVGFSHKFNNKLSSDFYYVRQNETGNRTRPGTLNGIGTGFRVNL